VDSRAVALDGRLITAISSAPSNSTLQAPIQSQAAVPPTARVTAADVATADVATAAELAAPPRPAAEATVAPVAPSTTETAPTTVTQTTAPVVAERVVTEATAGVLAMVGDETPAQEAKPAQAGSTSPSALAESQSNGKAPPRDAQTGADDGRRRGQDDRSSVQARASALPEAPLDETTPVDEPAPVLEAAAAPAGAQQAAPAEARAAMSVRGSPETVAAMAAQIARKLEGRNTRFEIALDPAGLGAVQVNVEINARGELTAHLAFERPEAAAELRARSAELQRALEQAGFDLSRGGLSFEHQGRREHAGGDQPRRDHARANAFQQALLQAEAADTLPARPSRLRDRTGLDVRI
jgi:hypothetical protein